ncbi:MAG: acetyltransferase [Oscillospiraceae bacterium]|nr:acetyltransferase [Oscillospiraceae bacterium]
MSDSVILIGGGGHARVIIDCIRAAGNEVIGILDDGLAAGTLVSDVPVLGKTADYEAYRRHEFLLAIGNNAVRRRIAEKLDVKWHTAVHPSAVISPYARVGAGTVVMPGAIINSGASVGSHCIINSGAVVEHDNCLGDYVHISPGAALGGIVTVGEGTHVGIGASVRNNICICDGCVIGAGGAVVKDITEPGTYVGVPVRKMK